MKIITFTTLYPNKEQPRHGIFVETRLRKLVEQGHVSSVVVAPVPWFPFKNKIFGQYSSYANVPYYEKRYGIDIYHPRYFSIPKIGMNVAPFFLTYSARKCIRKLLQSGYEFDLIDAHYFYPDGVAAVGLGKYFNKPVVITARGSDVNLISTYAQPRRMIRNAAKSANAIITVSGALKSKLVDIGVDEKMITVLRNGVDLEIFRPSEDRLSIRKKLGVSGTVLLSVGNLVELKGHHLVIEALSEIPDAMLIVIGKGPEEARLKNLVNKHSLQDRVIFIQYVPQNELYKYYSAADLLILASSREGWPNVLLESMACGTPVVSTKVGGTPDIVTDAVAGVLIESRTASEIVGGVRKMLEKYPDRVETSKYCERYGWEETTIGQEGLFSFIIKEHNGDYQSE